MQQFQCLSSSCVHSPPRSRGRFSQGCGGFMAPTSAHAPVFKRCSSAPVWASRPFPSPLTDCPFATLQKANTFRLIKVHYSTVHEKVPKSLQSYPTLCDHMDCSPPASSVHGILHVGILGWVAMPSSRGSSWPRDQTHASYISCIRGWILYH